MPITVTPRARQFELRMVSQRYQTELAARLNTRPPKKRGDPAADVVTSPKAPPVLSGGAAAEIEAA